MNPAEPTSNTDGISDVEAKKSRTLEFFEASKDSLIEKYPSVSDVVDQVKILDELLKNNQETVQFLNEQLETLKDPKNNDESDNLKAKLVVLVEEKKRFSRAKGKLIDPSGILVSELHEIDQMISSEKNEHDNKAEQFGSEFSSILPDDSAAKLTKLGEMNTYLVASQLYIETQKANLALGYQKDGVVPDSIQSRIDDLDKISVEIKSEIQEIDHGINEVKQAIAIAAELAGKVVTAEAEVVRTTKLASEANEKQEQAKKAADNNPLDQALQHALAAANDDVNIANLELISATAERALAVAVKEQKPQEELDPLREKATASRMEATEMASTIQKSRLDAANILLLKDAEDKIRKTAGTRDALDSKYVKAKSFLEVETDPAKKAILEASCKVLELEVSVARLKNTLAVYEKKQIEENITKIKEPTAFESSENNYDKLILDTKEKIKKTEALLLQAVEEEKLALAKVGISTPPIIQQIQAIPLPKIDDFKKSFTENFTAESAKAFKIEGNDTSAFYSINKLNPDTGKHEKYLEVEREGKKVHGYIGKDVDKNELAKDMVNAYLASGEKGPVVINMNGNDPELKKALEAAVDKAAINNPGLKRVEPTLGAALETAKPPADPDLHQRDSLGPQCK